ncbi:MAG: 3-deoxy-manno-octulosonate cytidylyltransferase, partial [Bacteroidales bacterium]|nr:3-deoxy-manno-octulosonate cytidylyltransferase [Bacteroidales bacterium]
SGEAPDVVINIQGDEPFVDASQLQALMACFDSPDTQIATLVKPFSEKDSYETLANPNSPKVLLNKEGEAMYFSRSVVPYLRNVPQEDYLQHHTFYKHIGIYAYRRDVLTQLAALAPTVLEKAESLEQLRWLENGYRIRTAITYVENVAVDTPEDVALCLTELARRK